MAGAPQQIEQTRRTDMEEDGMEAQVPPPPSIRTAPDDPREPYSPNYGASPGDVPAVPTSQPAGGRPATIPGVKPAPRPKFASVQTD